MSTHKVKEYSREKLTELAVISYNLRAYTKRWNEHFGAQNRTEMKLWESKMDKWIADNVESVIK